MSPKQLDEALNSSRTWSLNSRAMFIRDKTHSGGSYENYNDHDV